MKSSLPFDCIFSLCLATDISPNMTPAPYSQSYGERVMKFTNPTAKLILEIMERKKTNLAVSIDVTKTNDLLAIIDAVSPYVCLIKVKSLLDECLFTILNFDSHSRLISISWTTLTTH